MNDVQVGGFSRITKKEQKIKVIYERRKRSPNFDKGHLRASKRDKNNFPNVFLIVLDEVNLLHFLGGKGDASECWARKVFKLGPAKQI